MYTIYCMRIFVVQFPSWKYPWKMHGATNVITELRYFLRSKSVFFHDISSSFNDSNGAPAAQKTVKKSPYSYRKEQETNELIFPWLSWQARGRLRMTAESRKMVAKLRLIGWKWHADSVYSDLLSLLWSIDTCQNKVSAGQYHEAISRRQV